VKERSSVLLCMGAPDLQTHTSIVLKCLGNGEQSYSGERLTNWSDASSPGYVLSNFPEIKNKAEESQMKAGLFLH